MSWAEPVENPAGLREPRMVRGLRWSRMAADLPQTAGWTSRRQRRRFPANGEHGRAAGGGDPLPREAKPGNKNFEKREENKTGWKWRRGHCILGSSILSRLYGGCQERGDDKLLLNTLIYTQNAGEQVHTKGNDVNIQ